MSARKNYGDNNSKMNVIRMFWHIVKFVWPKSSICLFISYAYSIVFWWGLITGQDLQGDQVWNGFFYHDVWCFIANGQMFSAHLMLEFSVVIWSVKWHMWNDIWFQIVIKCDNWWLAFCSVFLVCHVLNNIIINYLSIIIVDFLLFKTSKIK